MGNDVGRLASCLPCGGGRHGDSAVTAEPSDEGIGHSFCYVRPDPAAAFASSKVNDHAEEGKGTTFRSISGASVSANASTPLSTSLLLSDLTWPPSAAFESSTSFSATPLDRRFLSGPLERALESPHLSLRRSFSHALQPRTRRAATLLLRGLTRAIARTVSAGSEQMIAGGVDDSDPSDLHASLQWAQGRAGEDRVHVVISEDHGWVFVGIYDGFNGPDATDYLLSNLYSAVQRELNGILWDDNNYDSQNPSSTTTNIEENPTFTTACELAANGSNKRRRFRGAAKKWEKSQRRWKCEWNSDRLELDRRLKEQLCRSSSRTAVKDSEVLKALSRALKKTEEAYLDIAEEMASENPELALMGSCVLVMLMKGEDVYLMNVGDSRVVLARVHNLWDSMGKPMQDLARISEETMHDLEAYDGGDPTDGLPNLAALQLTLDHSTCIGEEVLRIRKEHPDDASAVVNDRVKGSLKVTRAFGAGFLKQPKWNNGLLEMFRIDYVGTSAYITCSPFLHHHKLGPNDRFLILSSDGLYQYLTNEDAVAQVELFIATTPEGDPAQHLVEEVLFRAAEKAGMDFHELLEIPIGDRRRYHDDVSIIVISLEGRIWRCCV